MLQKHSYKQMHGVHALVTGGSGQIGRHLVPALLDVGMEVSVLTRSPHATSQLFPGSPVQIRMGDVTRRETLANALDGIDIVFHLASFSPQPGKSRGSYEDPEHWLVTAVGTENIVEAAVAANCSTLVYFSSVKAMGEEAGSQGFPNCETSSSTPETLYGRSKRAAEETVIRAATRDQICASVLRLPMVYGVDGGGNLARMLESVARRRFPPFPPICNRRSAVHVIDAVQAALQVATSAKANRQIYLVTDGEAYSTRWMYEQILEGLGRKVPSWHVPTGFWRFGATVGTLLERNLSINSPLTQETFGKLFGNSWFSSQRIEDELGFQAQHTLKSAIRSMAAHYSCRR